MNYRAAATGQLKDAPSKSATRSNASPALSNESTASESPRMRSQAGSRPNSQVGNRKGGGATALSYAATAAKKGGNGSDSGTMRKTGKTMGTQPTTALTSLVNTRIEVQLVDGSRAEGVLFAYDVYSGVAALLVPQSGDLPAETKHTVRLVKASNIRNVEVKGKGETKLPSVQEVKQEVVEARKARALAQAKERAARIGVGVSSHAQAVFEALSKTLPCRWDKKRIVVLDEIVIDPPYTVESCRELSSASFSLSRVKKVLQGELSRLEQSAAG
ncbi:hypothetical protein IWW36_003130 [Coemansia brasiliensis]|uniref:AD domain-containing protein n=1 Tax=Coemansia brasiliensis TaxID=2650707 RepID=A0A9W8IC70_9FUNG|nr:hypothetical protein IWW36_003130 [Coemansia brasiliensis]